MQRVLNGSFETDLTGWSLSTANGAEGILSRVDETAHVVVTTPTGTDWHLQLAQALELHAGLGYLLSFRARSSGQTNISASLQQEAAPYAIYAASGTLTLSSTWQTFTLAAANVDEQTSRIEFMLGAVAPGAWVEIDDVKLVETAP